jgi:phenylalanyl-tRNA synthetase beta chain
MIVAMKVLSAEKHPDADRLRVYTLRSTYKSPILQVCANLTNVYDVGDVVAVCQIGHKVSDDFMITEKVVRGVLSQGMMIGTIEAVSGDDVTEACANREF